MKKGYFVIRLEDLAGAGKKFKIQEKDVRFSSSIQNYFARKGTRPVVTPIHNA